MKLKTILCVALVCVLLVSALSPVVSAGLYVSAEAAVLMVAQTGELVFSRNAHERLSMASTTKIMTSLIALEQGTPEREVIVTQDMVAVEGTSMGLLPGDSVTLRTLVCGMLMSSGNDAANTVACVLGGSQEGFAHMMNERAKRIGMSETHFVTASGLDDDEHYSTAYDMALLGCESVKNPLFLSICSQKNITVYYGNPPYRRTLSNHNRLLQMYDSAIGIKTGFTKKSGRCLVCAAQRDGVTLVAVTLNAPDDWNDHMRMFEYGFSRVRATLLDASLHGISLQLVGGTGNSASVGFSSPPQAVLSADAGEVTREILIKQFEYAPVAKGTPVGRAIYSQDGKTVHEADIVIIEDVAAREYLPPKTQKVEQEYTFRDKIRQFIKRIADRIKGVKYG